jgi:hydroxymethylglutaryl-CoA lyase
VSTSNSSSDEIMPRKIQIREVGPRDGFQNEPETIPTVAKIRLINALARTGLKHIEVASFVRPDVIPQLSDGLEVLEGIDRPEGIEFTVLVPNERGLQNALSVSHLFDGIPVFLSASETHNQRNVNRPVADSLATLERMAPLICEQGLHCGAVIATSFGCPYEGSVDPARVVEIAGRLAAAGAREVGFGDTTGMANPRQVGDFFTRARDELPAVQLTAHFHNTRGQGLANALAALQAGVSSFESSFGELGGCPVPPGSTGNIASEDLVSMFDEMGVDTGVDLPALVDTSRAAQDVLGRRLTSHVLVAGPVQWRHD